MLAKKCLKNNPKIGLIFDMAGNKKKLVSPKISD
jgi:hypothetical protein